MPQRNNNLYGYQGNRLAVEAENYGANPLGKPPNMDN